MTDRTGRTLRGPGLAFLALVSCLALTSVACAKKDAATHQAVPAKPSVVQNEAGTEGGPRAIAAAAPAAIPSVPFGAAAAATVSRKLVREADVALVDLEDAGRAMAQIEAIAASVGGFVGGSDYSSRPDGAHDGTITLRVPGEGFEQAIAGIRKVGKVGRISINVQDVTDQYVDLDARIRNEEREEQELIKLYNRQGTLNDIITVEQKLAEVRGRIEQLKGSLRVLESQVSLSTIRVTLTEKGVPLPPLEEELEPYSARGHVQRAWRALVSFLRSLLTAVIYIVIVGWVVWLPLLLVIRWASRRRQQARERASGWLPPSIQEPASEQPADEPEEPEEGP